MGKERQKKIKVTPKHKLYELVTADILRKLDPNSVVKHNVQLKVVGSERTRQVDVYIKGQIAGLPISVVVDCKLYTHKLDVKDIDQFMGMVDDLKPNMGILVSSNGFTPGAVERAAKEGQRINLCSVFDGENLEYSVPLSFVAVLFKRSDIQMKLTFSNGTGETVNLVVPENQEWQLEHTSGLRKPFTEIADEIIKYDKEWFYKESGDIKIDTNFYMLVNGDSLLKMAEATISVRSNLIFSKKTINWSNGVTITDNSGSIISAENLSTNWIAMGDGWEEISIEAAQELYRAS